MTSLDDLWFLADRANQRVERALHRLESRYDGYLTRVQSCRVSRHRFRTLTERARQSGAPYGTHTIVHRDGRDVLLVRHDGIGKWVLPGGEVETNESFREAAERELAEETGIDAEYEGLAVLVELDIACGDHETRGVMPIFEARALADRPEIDDPDGEISDAGWFDSPPPDTRDRPYLRAWRERRTA